MRDDVFTPIEEVLRRVDLDRPEIGYAERRRISDAEWAQLEGAGLVRRIEDAEWAHCTACGDAEDVHFMPNAPEPYPYIWCQDLGLLRVEPERLQQWKPDVGRLAEALAAAFLCAGRVEELVPGRIWLLGRTVVGGRPREVFFGRQLAQHDGAAVVGGCRRFLAGVAPVVLAAGVIPEPAIWSGDPPPVLALPSVVTLEGDCVVADRAYLESALATTASPAVAATTASFPTPHGATWDDVRLVVTDLDVAVTVRGRSAKYSFAEAGFEEERKGGVPDLLWRLLRVFALRGGVVPFDAEELSQRELVNLKRQVSELRRRLRALLQLEDDPFRPTRTSRRYETRFTISTDETVLLPTPAGARWEDLAVREVAENRVAFSFATTARGAFRRGSRDDAGAELDVAEHEHAVERTYDLATLGLADRDGALKPAGLALRALLRAGGRLVRPANDPAMLALAGRLSKMAQIEAPASPFAFGAHESRWTAHFDAASALAATR